MASIKMIDEDKATGKVKKIYNEIKELILFQICIRVWLTSLII
jgi:hypothetical protein